MFPPHVAAVGCSVPFLVPNWYLAESCSCARNLEILFDSKLPRSTLRKFLLELHTISHVYAATGARLHSPPYRHILPPWGAAPLPLWPFLRSSLLSTFHLPETCLMGIWFCSPLDRSLLRLHPLWGAVPSPSKASLTTSPHSIHLGLAWLGLGPAAIGVEDYYIPCPTSRLGSSARWQRYVIASAFMPMSESWADPSALVDLVCRWVPSAYVPSSWPPARKPSSTTKSLMKWLPRSVRAPMQPSFIIKTHLASCLS